MRLEDRVRNELHDTAERLALDPGEYRRAVEAAQRRRHRQVIGALSGMVAVAGLVVIVLALRPGDEVVVSPSSTTSPATTAPSPTTTALPVARAGAAVVVAGPQGISWTELGADADTGVLESDPYYESISWAASDGEGGLVFTHEVTPLPWDQGTLLWLPAGAVAPRPIVAPPAGSLSTPIGVDDGRLYYIAQTCCGATEVVAVDLDGENQDVVVVPPAPIIAAAVTDGVIAVALRDNCHMLAFYSIEGSPISPPSWVPDCLPGSINDLDFTGDFLFTLENENDVLQIRRTDYRSGESFATPVGEGWQIDALDTGTLAVGGTVVTVGDFTGASFEPFFDLESANSFVLVPDLSIRTDASLGSGLGELPCMPLDLPALAPQGLPELVEAKRQLIFELASGCEMDRLAEVVLDDDAAYTFGGEQDPVRTWIHSARLGFDVMSMTVRMLNAEPAIDGSGAYAWPAVHATNAEDDWQALSGILSAAEYEQYYLNRESGYLGLRVGIDPEGRLAYLIAGD